MPSISVIIPTHNRKEFLSAAVNCVLAQSLQPQEIVIVDNGSDAVDQMIWPAPVRHIKTVCNAGPSQARNIGATFARGEYLAFLDDDDLWEPQYLEKVCDNLTKNVVDILLTRLDLLTETGCREWRKPSEDTLRTHVLMTSNPGITGSNIIISRQFFLASGGFCTRLRTGEDKAFIIDAIKQNAKIGMDSDIQAIHRNHNATSLSRDAIDKGLHDFFEYYFEDMSFFQKTYNKLRRYHYIHIKNGSHPIYNVLFRALCKFEYYFSKK